MRSSYTDHLTPPDTGLQARSWLAQTAVLPHAVARRRVRHAKGLADMPPVLADALAAGRLGEAHLGVLAVAWANPRTRDALADAMADIVAAAGAMAFEAWRHHVRALVELLDADGPEPAEPAQDDQLSITQSFDGRWALRGDFSRDTGELIHNALAATADRLFHARQRDDTLAPADLRAPTRRHLLAQALIEHTRTALAQGPHNNSRLPAAEVVIHLHHNTATGTCTGYDHHGIPYSTTELDRLCCDPLIRAVHFDPDGRLVALSSPTRLATPEQRAALAIRDGGCCFPGCDTPPRWCDAHHVVHWNHHGPTELSNLALLCRYHHGVTHRRGWTMTIDHAQHVTWTTPTGTTLHGQRHQQRAGP